MVDDAVVNNKTLGERGESIAVAFLKGQKFAIVERNFRCKAGEVDIVAREGKTLVFVEVKARGGRAYGDAAEAVTPLKRLRIVRRSLR